MHAPLATAKFAYLVVSKARQFYLGDQACLSHTSLPVRISFRHCLGEADLMRRVLASK